MLVWQKLQLRKHNWTRDSCISVRPDTDTTHLCYPLAHSKVSLSLTSYSPHFLMVAQILLVYLKSVALL